MNNKENFKTFVKQNPSLITHVHNNSMTWQQFYEMWDLYGENHEVWNKYLVKNTDNGDRGSKKPTSSNDVLGWIKGLDGEVVQNGLNGLQRILGLVGDLTVKNETTPPTKDYSPRPIFKHFED